MKSKIYRCNCREIWSILNRKSKTNARTILLKGKWKTELKPERKCDPKGFVTTDNNKDIVINPPIELLEPFVMVSKLIYNKSLVDFNIKEGEYLLFAEEGSCFILKKKQD